MRYHLHIPRAYCLCIVSSSFIISQVFTLSISNVNTLWIATVLLGFSYGSLWGSMPAIMIEWFGLGKCIRSLLYLAHTIIHGMLVVNSFQTTAGTMCSPSGRKLRMVRVCSPRWREPLFDHARKGSRRAYANPGLSILRTPAHMDRAL